MTLSGDSATAIHDVLNAYVDRLDGGDMTDDEDLARMDVIADLRDFIDSKGRWSDGE